MHSHRLENWSVSLIWHQDPRPPMPDVHLDPIAPRHADAVQALASHPDVLATTNLPEPYPDDGAIT